MEIKCGTYKDGARALMQEHPSNPDLVLIQADDLDHPYAFGWIEIPREDFIIDEEVEDE